MFVPYYYLCCRIIIASLLLLKFSFSIPHLPSTIITYMCVVRRVPLPVREYLYICELPVWKVTIHGGVDKSDLLAHEQDDYSHWFPSPHHCHSPTTLSPFYAWAFVSISCDGTRSGSTIKCSTSTIATQIPIVNLIIFNSFLFTLNLFLRMSPGIRICYCAGVAQSLL